MINEMAAEVQVHGVAISVGLHELVALDPQEAFLVVVVLRYLDQSLGAEGLSFPSWVVLQMVEVHGKVVGLPLQEVVVAALVEGDHEISLEGEVGH